MDCRITKVEVVRYPVVRVFFDDGDAGDYDLTDAIAMGPVFERLKNRDYFNNVAVGENGRSFGWSLDDLSNEIDLCADSTRITLETQDVRVLADEFERQHRPAAE